MFEPLHGRRRLAAVWVLSVLALSTYFEIGSSAQYASSGLAPLTIYHIGLNGQLEVPQGNGLSAGESIWLKAPPGATAPYSLTVNNGHGFSVWREQGTSFSNGDLIPVILQPSRVPATNTYSLVLRITIENLPGVMFVQTRYAQILVMPDFARLVAEQFSRANGSDSVQLKLLDANNRPKSGVRVGVTLSQGRFSIPVTNETTDSQGLALLHFGESLPSGHYSLEAKVLDGASVFAQPFQVGEFSVDALPTRISYNDDQGLIRATLLEADTGQPIPGRLLVLQTRADGNGWAIASTGYTDSLGQMVFAKPKGDWKVAFNGDTFYSAASFDSSTQSYRGTLAASIVQPGWGSCTSCCNQRPSGHSVAPACGGGGGGGGGGRVTSIVLLTPATAYATVPMTVSALLTYGGSPLSQNNVNFYINGVFYRTVLTNSGGYATMVWAPTTTGPLTMNATFAGTTQYSAVANWITWNVAPIPTSVLMLNPVSTAYSWDLNYPVALTVVTLQASPPNQWSAANIYMPNYNGTSSTPPNIYGYGWAGLNLTSAVTITYNNTFTMSQTMNWTRTLYLPPCPGFTGQSASCPKTPRSGHMYLTASLLPPSNLYASSTTSLSIPYQIVTASNSNNPPKLGEDFTPPAHLYVNVTAAYPFLTVNMQGLPVALGNYSYNMAYSLGPPLSSYSSSGFTYYSLPTGADYLHLCSDSLCSTPAANVSVALLKWSGYCGSVTTDSFGIAAVPQGRREPCAYPYSQARITTVAGLSLVEAFHSDYRGNFYTNFQGYSYSSYAPTRTGRYYVSVTDAPNTCTYTVIYPSTSYPDIQCPSSYSVEYFLNTERHPIQAGVAVNPGTPTILNNINATAQLSDLATGKPLGNLALNVTVTRVDPGTTTVALGVNVKTSINGTYTLPLGQLSYGNYSVAVNYSGNATLSSLSLSSTFTVYKAKPTLTLTAFAFVTSPSPADYYREGNATVGLRFNSLSQPTQPKFGAIAQSFKIAGTSPELLSSAKFYLQCPYSKCSTGPSLTANLYRGTNQLNMNNSLPEISQILAISKTVSESQIPSTPSLVTFDFSRANYILQPNTVYEISLTTTSNDTLVWVDNSAHTRRGGSYQCSGQWDFVDCSTANLGYTPVGVPFYVYAIPLTPLGSSWLQNAQVGSYYYFRTSLVNNQTQTPIAVQGLVENVTFNNAYYAGLLSDTGGNATFTWKPATAGQYTLSVKLPGQSYYYNSSLTVIDSVSLRSLVLAVTSTPPTPTLGQQVTWSVHAYDMVNNIPVSNKPISLYIDEILNSTTTTNSTGYATFSVPFQSAGGHNITFYSPANSVYNAVSSYDPLEVYLVTSLALQGGTITMGQSNPISLSLNYSTGVGVPQRNVRVEIDNSFYQNVTTDNNGHASFNWRPDRTGAHSITARFLANTINDIGVKPAAGALSVNVAPQTVTNTQTAIGTQALTFNTAQGTAQNTLGGPSVSLQFSLSSVTAIVHFNGRIVQTISAINNEFGWSCGWICLPYWRIHVDSSVTNVFDFHFVGSVFGSLATSGDILSPLPTDRDALNTGLDASLPIAGAALLTEIGLGGYADPGAIIAAGAVALMGMTVAMEAGMGLYYGKPESYRSYLYGLFFAPFAAIPCFMKVVTGTGWCPEIPKGFPVDVDVAMTSWLAYLIVGLYTPWNFAFLTPEVALALMMILIGLAFIGVMIALL